jgi:hypothetical protein
MELFPLTPGVLRMTGSAAALVSFAESSSLLQELAGVSVSRKQVERAAEALGAEIAADEHRCVEKRGEVAPTMYLGMDGTGVPMRAAEVAGRAGKQPDGSAKTREAKVITMWTAEARDAEDKPVRDLGSVTYSAAIESAATPDASPDRSAFAERVLREATRRGFTEAERSVVLGDGSPWIWNTARELFPQAIPILDRYHAKEAWHRAAHAVFGTTPESQQRAEQRCTELDEGRLRDIVHEIRCSARACTEATKCVWYIFHNRARMRYPKFRAHLHRRAGGRLQSGAWHSPQTCRDALDRAGCQRHHRPALLKAEWALGGLLGAAQGAARSVIPSLKSDVRPPAHILRGRGTGGRKRPRSG